MRQRTSEVSPERDSRAVPPVQAVKLELSPSRPIRVSLSSVGNPSEPRFDLHYGLELGIVLSGRIRRTYRSWEAELGPGEAWYCGIWEWHGWSVVEAPCEAVVVTMLPQVLATPEPVESMEHDWLAPFVVPPERRPRVAPEARQQLLAVAQQIREKRARRSPSRVWWYRLLTFEALSLLERDWSAPVWRSSLPHSYGGISRAVELVFGVRRLVTAGEAARACAMSGRTFRRAFEALMGISFTKFALRHRLSGAADQLAQSDEPLKAVAADWGFVDASHLHRSFAQYYRCTPEEYRRLARSGRAGQQPAPLTPGRPGGRRPGRRRSGV
ncbi:MAG: helix-turn-helix domain-containing protein [Armatimonadota bacterium]